ncbi:hypothetical protein NJ7G_1696 [Natrinema sp. J7-2]|nr:hypothetical protein NJ7G_1696 [Natrinema sp. J7-2]
MTSVVPLEPTRSEPGQLEDTQPIRWVRESLTHPSCSIGTRPHRRSADSARRRTRTQSGRHVSVTSDGRNGRLNYDTG